ncbi:Wadjet anti-phage system protein JetD domain-containing protein [Fuerstiella marisgermanici]|uniref:Wadjet protein JetD C-terminal domain-containing protein n=1 Tax=Fuerstiella marisgermanici TaxID=1891926 RepID=A0A1P8WL75_9PLAN|nr:Wadjet anti-phage system protein JetD domain-containing protein [Fuerstiella marisgermanici]APZ94806.1 hypothetical protein Fuma_04445 [Fuerstiella marisgermanici]
MITPDEITAKALRLYPKVIQAWLDDRELFPHVLRSSKTLGDDIVESISAVQELRNRSKERLGYGYSVEWVRRKPRSSGSNEFPNRILFETRDDLLRLVAKQDEFCALQSSVAKIRRHVPELEAWLRSHTMQLAGVAGAVDNLISVVQWFRKNPRPNRFAREIPLAVHGKFIEQRQRILQQWFDVEGVLSPDAIRADESNFFRRYWLRDWEPLITLRCLDEATQARFGLPCSEASIPIDHFNSVPLDGVRIFVVENLTNLRTFPQASNSIVIFGMGNAAVHLRTLDCLQSNEVVYWGDLDVFGLRILSQFRQLVGEARSLFMDSHTMREFPDLVHSPKKDYKIQKLPALLLPDEEEAFHACNEPKLQLEQEWIPHHAVLAALASLGDVP